jgi:Subtilase family
MNRRGTFLTGRVIALCAPALVTLALAPAAMAGERPERPVCPGPAAEGFARCFAHVVVDGHGSPATSPIPSGYGPAQFHGAYSLPVSAPIAQTIAIVDAYDDPTIRTDLTRYDQFYGVPDPPTCTATITSSCFEKVNQSGATSPLPSKNSGWALEIALDVETAREICQNCKIALVEASSSSGANLNAAEETAAVVLGATEISNSWGTSSEYSGELSENAHFNHPRIAITVASGDNGYERFGFPAASADVIDAGGTTLNVTQAQPGGVYSWAKETTWSGSGSGCSLYFYPRTWQTTALGWGGTGCAGRGVADVAADADPNTGAAVYDSTKYNGRSGWFQVGGTSLASPLIAGVYALAGNAASAEYPASIPYAHVSSLHDVTSGPNTGSCATTACKAGPGYDGPTGVGTPNGTAGF